MEVGAGDFGTGTCIQSSFVPAVEVSDFLEEFVAEKLDVDGGHSQAVIGDGVFDGGQNRFSGDWSEFEDSF